MNVLENLEECMHVQNVQAAVVGNVEQSNQQLMSIEKCKEIRNIALSDGLRSIAEEQVYIKAQLLERLVVLEITFTWRVLILNIHCTSLPCNLQTFLF